ncbi:PEP-utilizing enzyme [Methylomonas methanica]|uniref:Pyruvate phosphate dikinase PEP/pyruvate-binding protein n=1 Tax=Methylomonas methanica (strain DSM 25384 / MC09) TaxID=857087 RepID=F9ZWD6_METMM|nr:PEP/pyruvate-binding domain-containing protein [Methylomonas methanica]AEF99605.1 pyruvate phosphate dikinase PEP/pyruvate-binding protein [Methylomonas methanica MC09]
MIESSSKAQTLIRVKAKVSLFKVPELEFFDTDTFLSAPDQVVARVKSFFLGLPIVVRSSAVDEDGATFALAGEYDSVLNVPSDDPNAITTAIEKVITSYGRKGSRNGNDEVIVQEMVTNTCMSGVVFTHDLNTGAPYYVINYDDVSGLTNTVTSGGGEYANRTLYIHRGATQSLRSMRFQRLIEAIQELEQVMGSQFLDVEFALGEDFTPYLLQVRAITTQPNWNRAIAKRIDAALQGIQTYLRMRLRPMMGVYGQTTVLGQMPDWNPAEMIGRAPRALAFSLYKTLITDHAWRIAREAMGYAVPVGQPLMVSLAGQPFIDTRLSFHSFLPAGLSSEIGGKLVDAWVKRLQDLPELHDKVEFDVAVTAYSFDIDEKIETLIGSILNQSEKEQLKEAFRQQTCTLLSDNSEGSISKALAKVEELRRKQVNVHQLIVEEDIINLFAMIDNCIRLGTVPFSILARHGFIARTILLSLNKRGIFSMEDIDSIQSGVRTVASTLVSDMRRLQLGELSRTDFMVEYGHLRPGTYDILSRRYDQMSDFGIKDTHVNSEQEQKKFVLADNHRREIDALLQAEGFSETNADKLFDYIHTAIVGREYGKFVFTRSVSDMLELIANFAEKHGLSREEISHVSIDKLLEVLNKSSEGSIEERLRKIAEDEAEQHALSVGIRLPQVLFDEAGVHVVPFQISHPNFITHYNITAACVYLHGEQPVTALSGKIILIENADPGFDWIFAQQIGGLITKYGGANSHMAIRCAEFGIPAAIGCGEQRFEAFICANQILLDCAAGLIKPLH